MLSMNSSYFLLFLDYFHLGKDQGPSLEQTRIPFTQEYFVLCFGDIGPVVLKKISFGKGMARHSYTLEFPSTKKA